LLKENNFISQWVVVSKKRSKIPEATLFTLYGADSVFVALKHG
jgi:hypothetical protein